MKFTEIKGIGESTEKELAKIGITTVEQFGQTPLEEIFKSDVGSGKLAILFNYVGNKCTPEAVEDFRINLEKKQNAIKNDKYIGMKLWDSPQDTEMSTVITIHNSSRDLVYEVGDPSKSHGNSLYTKDQLIDLINNQKKYKMIKESNNENRKKEQERENEKLRKQQEEERIDREVYLIDEFTANMTPMKKAKVIKTLNKYARYNGKHSTMKKAIFDIIMNENGYSHKNEREYASKKINGEYAKLSKPKIELMVLNENNIGCDVNKTEFDYAQFLESKR